MEYLNMLKTKCHFCSISHLREKTYIVTLFLQDTSNEPLGF